MGPALRLPAGILGVLCIQGDLLPGQTAVVLPLAPQQLYAAPAAGKAGAHGRHRGHAPLAHGTDGLPPGGHGPFPVGPGLQGRAVRHAEASAQARTLAPGLGGHVAELVAQGLQPALGIRPEHPGGKADLRSVGVCVHPQPCQARLLPQPYAPQFHAEGGLHSCLHICGHSQGPLPLPGRGPHGIDGLGIAQVRRHHWGAADLLLPRPAPGSRRLPL